MTRESFLEECGKWLSPRDMEELGALDGEEETESASAVLKAWQEFNMSLKKDLASFREERKKGNEKKPGFLAGKVLEQANPLEMELYLEKAKWDFLENLEVGHFFDIGKLAVYYLKLGILVRLEKFDKDKGETYFHEICEVKHDNAAR